MNLKKITLAVNDLDAMTAFYSKLLGLDFSDLKIYNSTVKVAQINGIQLMLCPNNIAGVQADQARHQFEFSVNSLMEISLNEYFKTFIATEMSNSTELTLIDPDRNTIIITE
jgi:catechol-2,3-dioxygenase